MSVDTEAQAGKNAPRPAKRETDSPRILAADDEVHLRQLSMAVLLGAGYQVDTADDGAMAWHMLQAAKYDLLILVRVNDTDRNPAGCRGNHVLIRRVSLFVEVDSQKA